MRRGTGISLFGGISSGLIALCCVTPLLPIILGALGATSLLSAIYKDSVLFPALGVTLIIMGAGLWLKRKSK